MKKIFAKGRSVGPILTNKRVSKSKHLASKFSVLVLIVILALAMTACGGNKQAGDSGSNQAGGDNSAAGQGGQSNSATNTGSGEVTDIGDNDDDSWLDEVDLPGHDWRPDDMVAIASLGFLPYDDIDLYLESQDLQDFLDGYPWSDSYNLVVTDYMGIGDELYYIIPRYYDSEIVIKDAWDGDLVFYEGRGDEPILLLTNIGDIYTDAWVTITYKDEVLDVWPGMSGMDARLVTPEYGVLDISPGYPQFDMDEANNIAMMEGDWILYYVTDGGYEEEAYITLTDYYEHGDVREYKFYYSGIYNDLTKEGEVFYRPPIDFYDPDIDDQPNMLYISAIEYGQERFQLFGKFQYEYMNNNNFRLYHLDYDPLHPNEYGYSYVLERTQFAG